MLLAEHLPKMLGVKFSLINQLLTKKNISGLIDAVYRNCGQKETVIFCDRIMALGFHHAFKAGISFGKDDMLIPETKEAIVDKTNIEVRDFEQQYQDGLITQLEKYNKVVDAWSRCTDMIAKEMMDRISAVHRNPKTGREMPINSVYMMSHSGARGSPAQMKQLAGMRGLMTKPSGEIIETPIISNFKEGLSVLEYFNSTHGARKGLADTALKTANSGYLTRRLVDVAQDAIISEIDCGTDAGINVQAVVDAGQVIVSLAARVLGRTAQEDIKHPVTGEIVVANGTTDRGEGSRSHRQGRDPGSSNPLGLDVRDAQRRVREVLRPRSCTRYAGEHRRGCRRHRRSVDRRTRHAADDAYIPHRRYGEPRRLVLHREQLQRHGEAEEPRHREGLERPERLDDAHDVGRHRRSVGKELATHKISYGARMFVDEGDIVKRGTKISQWDPYTRPILSEANGTVDFEDLIEGASVREKTDEMKGTSNRVIVDWRATPRGAELKPAIVIKDSKGKPIKVARGGDARYLLSVDAVLSVDLVRR